MIGLMTSTILPYKFIVHNTTGYNLQFDEFHTQSALCKAQYNVQLPKNSSTTINWGACLFKNAILGGTIGNTITKDITKLKGVDVFGACGPTRHIMIFSADPIVRVENPLQPGSYTDVSRYVKFYIIVLPKAYCKGGLKAESGWYNKITGQLDDEGAKKAGL